MSKKGFKLSLGLASILAVGSFTNPSVSLAEDLALDNQSVTEASEDLQIQAKKIETINNTRNVVNTEVLEEAKASMQVAPEAVEQPAVEQAPAVESEPSVKEETAEAVNTEAPEKETTEDVNTETPEKETAEAVNTEAPEKETAEAVNTEEPEKETAEAVNTEAPEKETAEAVNTEAPEKETAEAVNTEAPEKETAEDVNTEAPEKEVAENVNTEAPEKEVAENVNTEAPEKEVAENVETENEQPVYETKTETPVKVEESTYNESEDVKSQVAAIESNVKDLEENLDKSETTLDTSEKQLEESKAQIRSIETTIEQENLVKASEYQVETQELKTRIDSLVAELESLKKEIQALRKEIETAKEPKYNENTTKVVGKANTDAKVYISPNKNSGVKGTIRAGASVSGNKVNGNYVEINYNGSKAYVLGNNVNTSTKATAVKPAENKAVAPKREDGKTEMWIKGDVYVRAEESSNSKILGVLTKGTKILGKRGDYWTEIVYNGIIAYVYNGFVSTQALTATNNTSGGVQTTSTVVTTTKTETKTNKEAKKVEEKKETKKSESSNKTASDVADAAYEHLGKPYVWGATGPNTFDCSGLTQYLYRTVAGVNINRVSYDQAKNGYEVSRNDMKKGDLLFFNNGGGRISHVGIYVGDGEMIHASSPTTGVIKSNITSGYYARTMVAVRRILG